MKQPHEKNNYPHSVRLTLLQTAVRSVPELRIVETMDEYMVLTNSSTGQISITHDKYFMMLQNASIRYDKNLKQKHSKTSRAVHQHELDDNPSVHDEEDDYLDDNFAPYSIDTPSDDIYNVHNTNFKMAPHVKSLIPRTSPEKSKPNETIPPKSRYIMDLCTSLSMLINQLSEDIKNKYNQDKKAQYKRTCPRMAKAHEQDHEEGIALIVLSLTWRTMSLKSHILC